MTDIHSFAKARVDYLSRKGLLLMAVQAAIEHRSSPFRFLQSVIFSWQFRVQPDAFYRYKIFQNWRRRHRYVFADEMHVVLRELNKKFAASDSADLADKRKFERRCAAAGLPCARSLTNDPEHDIFGKYPDRWCGEGAAIWRYSGGKYHNNGESLSFQELAKRNVILQPIYRNHPDIADVSGNALSTVRVVTARDKDQIRVCAAVFRSSSDDSAADNFALGGLAAPIDLTTGGTGCAVVKDIRRRPNRFEKHPVGGGSFTGKTIPFWDQIKQLSVKAHELFATMPSVGWDIAITPDGPILLEGNPIWCVDLVQMTYDAPLGDGPIPELLLDSTRSYPVEF